MARTHNKRHANGNATTHCSMKQVPHEVVSELYALQGVCVSHVNVVTDKAGRLDFWVNATAKALGGLRKFAKENTCVLTESLASQSSQKKRVETPVVMLQIVLNAFVKVLPECDQLKLIEEFNKVCGTVVTLDQFEYAFGKKSCNKQIATAYVMITGVPNAERTAWNIANPWDPAFRGQKVELSVGRATLLTLQTSEKPAVYKKEKHVKGQGKKKRNQMSMSSSESFRTAGTDSPQAMSAVAPDYRTESEGWEPTDQMCDYYYTPPMASMCERYTYPAAPSPFVLQEYGTDSRALIEPVQSVVQSTQHQPYPHEHESFATYYY